MTHLIACSMLKQELTPYLPPELPVTWLERGLHEHPPRLREAVQRELDHLPSEVDRVLMGYGFCGSAMDGVSCAAAELVLPLFDDCIGMLLQGERCARKLYFTASWLEDEMFIGNAYDRAVEDYGQEMADEIYEIMIGAYKSITLLDTQCFDKELAMDTIATCAQKLGLKVEQESATTHRLQDLLNGGNTPEFWHLKAGQQFTLIEFLERKKQSNRERS